MNRLQPTSLLAPFGALLLAGVFFLPVAMLEAFAGLMDASITEEAPRLNAAFWAGAFAAVFGAVFFSFGVYSAAQRSSGPSRLTYRLAMAGLGTGSFFAVAAHIQAYRTLSAIAAAELIEGDSVLASLTPTKAAGCIGFILIVIASILLASTSIREKPSGRMSGRGAWLRCMFWVSALLLVGGAAFLSYSTLRFISVVQSETAVEPIAVASGVFGALLGSSVATLGFMGFAIGGAVGERGISVPAPSAVRHSK